MKTKAGSVGVGVDPGGLGGMWPSVQWPSGCGPPPRNGQATFSLYKFLLVPSALVTQGSSNPASLEGTLCERGVSPRSSRKGRKTRVPRAPQGGADGQDSIKANSDLRVFNGRSCNSWGSHRSPSGAPPAPGDSLSELLQLLRGQGSGRARGHRARPRCDQPRTLPWRQGRAPREAPARTHGSRLGPRTSACVAARGCWPRSCV